MPIFRSPPGGAGGSRRTRRAPRSSIAAKFQLVRFSPRHFAFRPELSRCGSIRTLRLSCRRARGVRRNAGWWGVALGPR